jgi:hypothetical protein
MTRKHRSTTHQGHRASTSDSRICQKRTGDAALCAFTRATGHKLLSLHQVRSSVLLAQATITTGERRSKCQAADVNAFNCSERRPRRCPSTLIGHCESPLPGHTIFFTSRVRLIIASLSSSCYSSIRNSCTTSFWHRRQKQDIIAMYCPLV